MAQNVDLTYINAALTRTGSSTLTSLTGTSPGAVIAAQNYETKVKALLAEYPWKAAKKTVLLSAYDGDLEGVPAEPWTNGYQKPTDLVEIHTIKNAGSPIDYAIMGDAILANYDTTAELLCHYAWRVPETWWPAWFAEGVTQMMEAMFLRGIGERYDEAEAREKSAMRQFQTAKTRDAQQQPGSDPHVYGTLAARTA